MKTKGLSRRYPRKISLLKDLAEPLASVWVKRKTVVRSTICGLGVQPTAGREERVCIFSTYGHAFNEENPRPSGAWTGAPSKAK